MHNADKKKFAVLMEMLAENFDKENSKLKIDLYFESLKDFAIGEIEGAVYQSIKSLKWFPKIAELRELIEGDPDSRALIAWRYAVDNRDESRTFEFDDPIIHYCIQEIFGDWISFCEKTLEELKWEEKRFIGLYQLALKRPDIARYAPKQMLGSYEIHNSALGFHEHIPPVIKVETGIGRVKEIEAPKPKKLLEKI